MKKCIFCNDSLNEVGRSREHIFPQWILDEWNLKSSSVSPTHYDEELNVISTRTHNFDNFLAGSVCTGCNTGWMSQLEGRCKKMILSLASTDLDISDLSENEAKLLAAWTAKTAYALHSASNWVKIIPQSHIYKLDSEDLKLPRNTFIVGHSARSSKKISWQQGRGGEILCSHRDVSEDEINIFKNTGYKISFMIGGLFLCIFHNPLPEGLPCISWGKHIPLYPRCSHPVGWKKDDDVWPEDHMQRFYTFIHEINIIIHNSEPAGAGQPDNPHVKL
ncbi:hypothetical protein ACWPKS_08565 [Coraliomargarita sp. W4R72]